MSHAAPIRALVLAVVLVIVSAPPAHAGTIVFDFEDGLQGWELSGAVQRVQTQLLGGEWALFGDGFPPFEGPEISIDVTGVSTITEGPEISISIDLTGVSTITVDQYFVQGDASAGFRLIRVRPVAPDSTVGPIIEGTDFIALNPEQNPSLLQATLVRPGEFERISITWGRGPFLLFGPSPPDAFIDNITFHTIPEPSVLGMLVMGGVAALATRRARRGSA